VHTAVVQKRHRDRQSISFMYTKPPGLEAALAKQAAAEADKVCVLMSMVVHVGVEDGGGSIEAMLWQVVAM